MSAAGLPQSLSSSAVRAILHHCTTNQADRWKIEHMDGQVIREGSRICLLDSGLGIHALVNVQELLYVEREWAVFGLGDGGFLTVPRSRVTLSPFQSLRYWFLSPWLPSTIPPPVNPPGQPALQAAPSNKRSRPPTTSLEFTSLPPHPNARPKSFGHGRPPT